MACSNPAANHLQRLSNHALSAWACALQGIEDATGREDLIESLRNALLVRIAALLGYNKIARGDNATRIAARVIAMSSKGAGFALPACIQYFDRRSVSVLSVMGAHEKRPLLTGR